MTENKTLTSSDAIASAAAKVAERVSGGMPKAASDRGKRFDRSKPEHFNPDACALYQNKDNKDDISACFVGADGKTPDPKALAEYEFPPFLIARGSKIFGEGDAFKDVPNKKGVKVSRGSAHFRLILVKEVSDEMAALYPEWRAWQQKTVDDIRRVSIKLITEAFKLKNPPNNWVPFINNAWKAARAAIAIPGRKQLSDADIDERIEASAELKKELAELALASFISEARYPFKPSVDPATKQPRQDLASIEAKVYATTDYKEDVYWNENKGPDEIAFPSKREHIGYVIEIMKALPGKGGKGIDKRTYTPLTFVNKMAKRAPSERELKAEARAKRKYERAVAAAKKKGEPVPPPPPKPRDPIADREDFVREDGELVPDYWWNPTTTQNGRPIQSYGVAVGGLDMTASELGGYGTKFIMRNSRKVYIVDFEDVPDREIADYGKRVHESDRAPVADVADDEDDDSDDSESDGEPKEKRRKTETPQTNGGGPADTRPQIADREGDDEMPIEL